MLNWLRFRILMIDYKELLHAIVSWVGNSLSFYLVINSKSPFRSFSEAINGKFLVGLLLSCSKVANNILLNGRYLAHACASRVVNYFEKNSNYNNWLSAKIYIVSRIQIWILKEFINYCFDFIFYLFAKKNVIQEEKWARSGRRRIKARCTSWRRGAQIRNRGEIQILHLLGNRRNITVARE
jgi:hypothetical protein